MFVSIPRAKSKRTLGREVAIFSFLSGGVPRDAFFNFAKACCIEHGICLVLCPEPLLGLLQTYYNENKCIHHVLHFNNVLLRIVIANFVVFEDRCKIILSFSGFSFFRFHNRNMSDREDARGDSWKVKRPEGFFCEIFTSCILLERLMAWMIVLRCWKM